MLRVNVYVLIFYDHYSTTNRRYQ